jgi:Undecaprenyl-phosphate glucose phosphotransferase
MLEENAINWRNWLPSIPRRFSASIATGLIAIIDILTVMGIGLAVYFIYVGKENSEIYPYFYLLVIYALSIVGIFYNAGLYKLEPFRQPTHYLKTIVTTCVLVFLLLSALGFALKVSDQLSRVWAFSTVILSILLLYSVRIAYFSFLNKLARSGSLTRNVMLIGGGKQTERWLEKFDAEKYPWIRIVGVFDDRKARIPDKFGNIPVIGNTDDLLAEARNLSCDDIIIMLPWEAEERILGILKKLRVLPVYVRLGPDLITTDFPKSRFEQYGGFTMLSIFNKPIDDWKHIIKLIEDRGFALLMLLLLLPLMLIIGIIIKLESQGPVFFKQKRYGFNNRLIDVLKFRTMFIDQQDADAEKLTSKDDPRVTRVGRFLRHTSLDELPQFINVLRGEMSVVGPRPHAIKASAAGKLYQDAVSEYAVRHKVKPGITGWAQINGWRGETETVEQIKKRVEHDIYYIENWSLLLDLKIIAMTPFRLSGKNAY